MNSSKTVTANFVQQSTTTQQPQRYTLTIDINPQSGGIVELNPQGGEYVEGTTVTLTAVANSGWVFSSWSGSLTGSQNPATIVMNSSKTVTANFVRSSYTLTVNINPSGAGSVTLNPSGGVYVAGTTVTLTAVANSGWVFSGWSGDLSGNQNPTTIVMNSSKTVTANFVQQSSTTESGGGNGEGGGSGEGGGVGGEVSGGEINSKTNKLYINLTNKQTETIVVDKTEVEWIKVYDLKGKLIDSYDGNTLDVKRYKVGSYIFELKLKDGRTKYGTMVVVK
jgi:uncharacterized repeat protein (TIGR02543 family)